LRLDPELSGAYADPGRAYEQKGERDKAIADYEKALSLKSRQLDDDKAKKEAAKHLKALTGSAPENAASSR
jgi:tetratricopeptide (TPR) repeat protein